MSEAICPAGGVTSVRESRNHPPTTTPGGAQRSPGVITTLRSLSQLYTESGIAARSPEPNHTGNKLDT